MNKENKQKKSEAEQEAEREARDREFKRRGVVFLRAYRPHYYHLFGVFFLYLPEVFRARLSHGNCKKIHFFVLSARLRGEELEGIGVVKLTYHDFGVVLYPPIRYRPVERFYAPLAGEIL